MNQIITPDEKIISKIYLIRNQKVMLDADIADLFEVTSRRLREQVGRNLEKFPEHFMFRLTELEVEMMIAEKAIASKQIL
jgi:hypothetical protein